MKKSLTLLALALGLSNSFAQELKSKKEEVILPEAGDWAIGIDATPFLNYAGNMFGKTAANIAPTFDFHNTQQIITGKYFKDAKTAYRGSLRIGMNSNTQRAMVGDRMTTSTVVAYPTQDPMVENTWKASRTDIGLSGGIEMRKGKTRLQGYYGGEVGLYFGNSKDKFTYGNALSTNTVNPVDVTGADQFAGASNIDATAPIQGLNGSARVTERKNGSTIGFGVRGFIGAEFFILPKLSLGGEFGWGLGISSNGKTTTTYESKGISNAPGSVESTGTTTIESSKQGGFSLDTDNNNTMWAPSGSLRINLHL
ncbi:MAG: hypothetical protein ACK50A_01345 [Sphingobacteriaceae bacterium]